MALDFMRIRKGGNPNMRSGTVLLGAVLLCVASAMTGCSQKQPAPLWAGISVDRPVFHEDTCRDMQLHFTVINQSSETIDPQIVKSQLYVNGEKLQASQQIFSNAPQYDCFKAVKPGECMEFEYYLGQYFDKPGIYQVAWKGDGFETHPVLFRVEPKASRAQ